MIVSTNGSISKEIASADVDCVDELLRTRLQEKQDELLAWVNEWHLIDMHALVFVMETTLTLLRSQMSPLDEKLLERLHTTFCGVAVKREGNHET